MIRACEPQPRVFPEQAWAEKENEFEITDTSLSTFREQDKRADSRSYRAWNSKLFPKTGILLFFDMPLQFGKAQIEKQVKAIPNGLGNKSMGE